MTDTLAKTVCSVHPVRPATARCPSCRGFFCAECVTEHGGRYFCSFCLAAALSGEKEATVRRRRVFPAAALLQGISAVLLVWTMFYFFARFLGDIPDAVHDGTIWE